MPTIGFASDPREINPVHLTIARRTAVVYDTPLAVVTAGGVRAARGGVSIRQHPRIRALARRHVGLLLARARRLGERGQRAAPARRGQPPQPSPSAAATDPLLDVLYWQPFVRWATSHFGLAPAGEPAAVPAGLVLALAEEYRSGDAPPRPLLKRARYERGEAAPGGIVPWSAEAVQGVLGGAPTIAILPPSGAVEADLDLALRIASELGESLPLLSQDHLTRLLQALRGPEAELQWSTGP